MKIQAGGRFPSHVSSKSQSVPPSQHANNLNVLVFINFPLPLISPWTPDCCSWWLWPFGSLRPSTQCQSSSLSERLPIIWATTSWKPSASSIGRRSTRSFSISSILPYSICCRCWSWPWVSHAANNAMIYPHTSDSHCLSIFFCFRSHQVLYSRIAIALWKSSRGLERHIALQNTTSSNYSNNFNRKPSSKYEKRAVGVTESQVSMASSGNDEGTQIQLDRAFVLGRWYWGKAV